jgi:hypothetical protein
MNPTIHQAGYEQGLCKWRNDGQPQVGEKEETRRDSIWEMLSKGGYPPVFLAKSAQDTEEERVEQYPGNGRVRKGLKIKDGVIWWEWKE